MVRITCDGCGKEVHPGQNHHVVKIEVFASNDFTGLTEADLDQDHVDAMGEMLRQLDDSNDSMEPEPIQQQLRYDLCGDCRKRYLRDPLGKDVAAKLLFSKN